MNAHDDKSKENKSELVANALSQKQSSFDASFQFVDNRTEAVVQRKLQETANNSTQVTQLSAFQNMADQSASPQPQVIQKKTNNTGLPDNLKTGIESLSGISMDDVKVHRNSVKPAQLQAHAYAQGTDIHLGPRQEKHLPHEAWHVVQQKQGRVKPTMQLKGKVNINDDSGLEKEADVMGALALQLRKEKGQDEPKIDNTSQAMQLKSFQLMTNNTVIQCQKANGAYRVNTNANLRRAGWPYSSIQVVPAGTQVNVINNGARQENFSLGGILGSKQHHSWVQLANHVEGWIKDSNLSTEGKFLADQLATDTVDRLKGGRRGAALGISATPQYAQNDYRRALACYNFAVGSFNNNADERQLQASVPEYVSHRYGLGGTVLSRAVARQSTISGGITAGRAAAIDDLMHNAGMNIVAGQHNPDWFGPGAAALRSTLKMPLQRYILSQSGFELNPAGNWAVGFRGKNSALGSDHAWLKAIDPLHPNRYITFDTFPNNPGVQANRKRHADPYLPEPEDIDFEIKVTGPTLPQQAIIAQIPDAAPVLVETNTDDRTNLHPEGY